MPAVATVHACSAGELSGGRVADLVVTAPGAEPVAFSVMVNDWTWEAIGWPQRVPYLQCRALVWTGYLADAQALAAPYAAGSAGPPDTRNWAQRLLDGEMVG
jgi:hypothetical protein